jgi:hypothetical protein
MPAKSPRAKPDAPRAAPAAIDAMRRREQISAIAYYKAERRGFAPGREMEDWLEAEREYDAHLASTPAAADVVATSFAETSTASAGSKHKRRASRNSPSRVRGI